MMPDAEVALGALQFRSRGYAAKRLRRLVHLSRSSCKSAAETGSNADAAHRQGTPERPRAFPTAGLKSLATRCVTADPYPADPCLFSPDFYPGFKETQYRGVGGNRTRDEGLQFPT